MTSQFENTKPEWAHGLDEVQLAAVRREAVRQGKRPAVLVKEWVMAQARTLTEQPGTAAADRPDCHA